MVVALSPFLCVCQFVQQARVVRWGQDGLPSKGAGYKGGIRQWQ